MEDIVAMSQHLEGNGNNFEQLEPQTVRQTDTVPLRIVLYTKEDKTDINTRSDLKQS